MCINRPVWLQLASLFRNHVLKVNLLSAHLNLQHIYCAYDMKTLVEHTPFIYQVTYI